MQVVTATVTIPPGAVGVNGTLRGISVGSANVVASSPGYSSGTTLASTTGTINILTAPFILNPELPRNVTLRLESGGVPVAAPSPGVLVSLVASDPTCLSVASEATIGTGLVSTSTVLTYGGTATLPCTSTLTLTAPGLTPHVVDVTVNAVSNITLFAPGGIRVGGGLTTSLSADGWGLSWQLGDGNHSGGTMRIRSLDPAKLLVARDGNAPGQEFIDVTLNAAQTTVAFGLKAVEGQTGTVDITATMTGYNSGTVSADVVNPALQVVSLPPTTTAQSPESVFLVAVGIPDASGTFLRQVQPPQRDLTVSLANSNATVGQLHTLAQTGQAGTVTITPSSSGYSPGTIAAGGVAFDPISSGQTTVTAAATNWTTVAPTSADVTVTGADITIFAPGGLRVGGGLMTNLSASGWTLLWQLGASGHTGGSLHLCSSDALRLTVAADFASSGQQCVDIPVAAGSTQVPFVIRGVEGQTGTIDLTATMTGFNPGTVQAEVVQPALGLSGVPPSTTTQSEETLFQVAIGIRDPGNTFLTSVQLAQRDVTVSISNSTPAVGQLHTSTQTSQTGIVTIAANSSYSPGTLASGGIAFDPLANGETTLTAVATNFPTALGTSANVTVTDVGISLFAPGGVVVGSGLLTSTSADGWTLVWQLGASGHGGGTMRIRSLNPALLKVAADLNSPAEEFIDVPVPIGGSSAAFVVHGAAGQTGRTQLTATMTGFTSGSVDADVVQP
ncbi:MAG: hypothetical protein WBC51_01710, partial [Vicinamibacterales bacterium]